MPRRFTLFALALLPGLAVAAATQAPVDREWTANAALIEVRTLTDPDLGAAQGVSIRDDKLYVYGDREGDMPRVGILREYDRDGKATGRTVWLRRAGKPLLLHPTGLTWDTGGRAFLGDTVNRQSRIYHLDWEQALRDGNLDNAVRAEVVDDAARNGGRPEFVTLAGRRLLATADYGDNAPEVRLYDAEKMLAAGRTAAAGVIVARFAVGPYNQNLHWDEAAGQLTCEQNVVAGLGWRLDVLDLAKAVAAGRADADGVRVRTLTFPPHDELEGYRPLEGGRALFITSSAANNLVFGKPKGIVPRPTPAGTRRYD